jgi:hypothetical protein
MSQGKCRGCGAEIDFLRMKSGKRMPVEREPVCTPKNDIATYWG